MGSEIMQSKPVFMLNALWFKQDAGTEGGETLYRRYLAEAARVIKQLEIGAVTHTMLTPEETLIGTGLGDNWDPDLFFVVEYPSKEAFDRLVSSPEYLAIRPLREDALEKSLLIQCARYS